MLDEFSCNLVQNTALDIQMPKFDTSQHISILAAVTIPVFERALLLLYYVHISCDCGTICAGKITNRQLTQSVSIYFLMVPLCTMIFTTESLAKYVMKYVSTTQTMF